jgi:drebrin-like protein
VELVDSIPQTQQETVPEPEPEPADTYEIPIPPPPPPVFGATTSTAAATLPSKAESPKDDGTVAVALYDYDAAEGNEISFSEGDRITNIVAASDDWWEGTAPNGERGLFPANYVELQE